MGVVKNLFVRVGADVRGVVNGMDKAGKATAAAEKSIRKDTGSAGKSIKESFENGRKTVREYADELSATKASHQTASAEVERMSDKLEQLEETFGTIVNATDGLDLSKSLSSQIQAAEKDLESVNAKIRKTQTALDGLGDTSRGKKAERAAALQEDLRDLITQSDEAAAHLQALDQAAQRVGSDNMGQASAAGLKQLRAEIDATRNRMNTAKLVAEETGRKLRNMGVGVSWEQMLGQQFTNLITSFHNLKLSAGAALSDAGAGFQRLQASVRAIPANIVGSLAGAVDRVSNAVRNLPNVPGVLLSGLKKIGHTAIEVAGSGLKHLSREFARLVGSAVRGIVSIPGKLLSIGRSAASGCGGLNRMVRSIRNIGVVSLGLRVATGVFGRLRSIISTYISTNEELYASVTAMRNQMGEALLPAINMVIGAMQRLMPIVTQVSHAVSSLFTAIFGKAQATSAAVKKTASEAASAAEGLQTYGFDQITKVSESGSGGSGTAGNATANGQTAQQSALVTQLTGWIQELKACFTAGDWAGLGSTMAAGITIAFDALDRVDVGPKISRFVNASMTAAGALFEGVDFAGIGGSLGTKFSAVIAGVDWARAGQVVGQVFTALPKTIVGFMQQTDWGAVGSNLTSLLHSAFQTVGEFFRKTDWLQLGRSVSEFLQQTDWAMIATDLCGFLGQALGSAGAFVWGLLEKTVTKIGAHFSKSFELCGGDILAGLLHGILTGLVNIGVWIYENMLVPIVNGFKEAFGIHSPSTVMSHWAEFIPEGVVGGISKKWHLVTDFLAKAAGKLSEAWGSICSGVSGAFSGIWEDVKPFLNKLISGVESMANYIIRGVNKIIDGFNKVAGLGDAIGLDLSMKRISEVSLPRLAQGAVLQPNKPFAAIVGDQKSGVNVETPLSVIQEAVAEVLRELEIGQTAKLNGESPRAVSVAPAVASALVELAARLAGKQSAQTDAGAEKRSITIPIYVGGRKVAEKVIEDINQITRENGVCPIKV